MAKIIHFLVCGISNEQILSGWGKKNLTF